jgi:hypothetical protein
MWSAEKRSHTNAECYQVASSHIEVTVIWRAEKRSHISAECYQVASSHIEATVIQYLNLLNFSVN